MAAVAAIPRQSAPLANDEERGPITRRDMRVDVWRGLCIVGMAAWHLLTAPEFPRWLAFPVIQSFNFVAEGFVLLAGLSIGLSSRRRPSGYFYRRAVALLLVHYGLTLSIGLFVQLAVEGSTIEPARLSALLTDTLLLRYQPYLGDVLSLFVFLFAMTPLLLMIQQHWGTRFLLAASCSLFLLANLAPDLTTLRVVAAWDPNHQGAFDVGSWQLVFVGGILLGQNYGRILRTLERWPWRFVTAFSVLFALLLVFRLFVELELRTGHALPAMLAYGRHPLSLARTLYIASQLMLVSTFTVSLWPRLEHRRLTGLLADLGRSSLLVFTVSVALDYVLKQFVLSREPHFLIVLATGLTEMLILALMARSLRKTPEAARLELSRHALGSAQGNGVC